MSKMKVKIYILFIFLLFGVYAGQAQKWGYDNAFEKESMNKIWTQGLDTVYIVGENLIAMSIDRGCTWNKQYIRDNSSMPKSTELSPRLIDIVFCDQKNGFVITADGDILKTIDGGNTWEKICMVLLSANAIACTGLDNIWIVGEGNVVLHSIDAGETWEPVIIDASPNSYHSFNSIAFKNNIGYIAGGSPAVLYKTEDNGQTWIKQLMDDQADIQRDFTLFHSLSLTAGKGYVCFNSSRLASSSLFQTEDYQNWHETSLDFLAESISFLNDTVGYSFSATRGGHDPVLNVYIFKTEDGGDNWNSVEVDYGPSGYLYRYSLNKEYYTNYHIQLVNDTIGYAVSGTVFCRMPLPDYDSWVNIEGQETSDTSILLYNRGSDLFIKSQKLPIVSVQIIDISGKVLATQKWNMTGEYEKNINTSVIPKGLYLIRTILSDNSVHVNKWMKN